MPLFGWKVKSPREALSISVCNIIHLRPRESWSVPGELVVQLAIYKYLVEAVWCAVHLSAAYVHVNWFHEPTVGVEPTAFRLRNGRSTY